MIEHNTDPLEIPAFLRRSKVDGGTTKTRAPRRKKFSMPKLKLVKAPAAWETAKEVLLQPGIDWPKNSGPSHARKFLVKSSRSKKYVWVRDASHAFGYRTEEWLKNEETKQPELTKVIRGIRPVLKLTRKQFDRALIKGETE